jgi:hypothetical protein
MEICTALTSNDDSPVMIRLFTKRLLGPFLTSARQPSNGKVRDVHSTRIYDFVPRFDLRSGFLDLGALGRDRLVSKEGEQREFVDGEDPGDDGGTSHERCLRRMDVRSKVAWTECC